MWERCEQKSNQCNVKGDDPILFLSDGKYKPTSLFCEVNQINWIKSFSISQW